MATTVKEGNFVPITRSTEALHFLEVEQARDWVTKLY